MDILLAYLAVAHFDRRNASPGQVAFCGAVDRLPGDLRSPILYWDRCWRRLLEVGRQMPLTGAGAAAHESTKKGRLLMEKVTPKKKTKILLNVFSVEALGARRELAEATLRIVDLFEPLLSETFKQY